MKLLYFLLIIIVPLFSKESPSPFIKFQDLIPHTYRIGFTNLDKEISINLKVTGKIPNWINGTLYRNGPAKFNTNKSWVNNWFDGLAMLHSFNINKGKVTYVNKFIHTNDFNYVNQTNKMDYFGYVQDPCESIFAKISAFFNKKLSVPNANVNIVKFDKKLAALTETPLPIEFDSNTLQTLGPIIYNDSHPKSNVQECVHPHYDYESNELISYFTTFGFSSAYNIYKINGQKLQRNILCKIKSLKPAYMHTFAITDKYIVLVELPLRADKFSFMFKNKGFINNFKYQQKLGTNFIVVDKQTGKVVGKFNTYAFFAFHIVNAFERDNQIIIDIVTYKNSDVIQQAYFEILLSPIKLETNYDIKLKRFIIDLTHKKIEHNTISSEQLELPRINYELFNGKKYNFIYAIARDNDLLQPFYVANRLIKIDLKTRKTLSWHENNCYPGEPIFVSKPNSKIEDDGVILSIVLDTNKQTSFLLILNAKDFKEMARASLPHHIPFGIHGQFYS